MDEYIVVRFHGSTHPSIMGVLFRQKSMLGGGIANTRSLPATHRLYNPSALDIPDAADGLASGASLPAVQPGQACC